MSFRATTYEGKPAVLDTTTRVFYFGYANKREAEKHANRLNKREES